MLVKLLCFMFVSGCVCSYVNDEEYVDSVIDMLLNGGSREFELEEDNGEDQRTNNGAGVWKCGECDNIDESNLMYTEVNDVDANMVTDTSVDIEIGLSLSNMRCITVQSESAGTVRHLTGDCSGGDVILSVAPTHYFTINVYS